MRFIILWSSCPHTTDCTHRYGNATPRRDGEKFDYSRFAKSSAPAASAATGLVNVVHSLRSALGDCSLSATASSCDAKHAPRNTLDDSPSKFWCSTGLGPQSLSLFFHQPVCPLEMSIACRGVQSFRVTWTGEAHDRAKDIPTSYQHPADAVLLSGAGAQVSGEVNDIATDRVVTTLFAVPRGTALLVSRIDIDILSIGRESPFAVVHQIVLRGLDTQYSSFESPAAKLLNEELDDDDDDGNVFEGAGGPQRPAYSDPKAMAVPQLSLRAALDSSQRG